MRSLLCLFLLVVTFTALFASPCAAQFEEEDAAALVELPDTSSTDAIHTDTELIEFDTEAAADADDEFEVVAVDESNENEIEYEINQADSAALLSSLRAPPKQFLGKRHVSLGEDIESVKISKAPASPKLGDFPVKTLPTQTLAKQHGPRLGLMRLPRKVSAKKEHRPVLTLAPLPPRKRAPQYRQRLEKQEVIQPVVSIQPMLHQRVLTRTIMQPTLQKQPVIQRIITQPILRREIREQPITQQQIKYQNIVQTRRVTQPEIKEELKVEKETEPKQTVESKGAPYPRLTAPPKKHH